jgi:hypothetical protein
VTIAWQEPVSVGTQGFGGLITTPRAASADTTSGYSDQAVVLGRLKPGKVRESHRVVHVVPLEPGLQHQPVVTARCGTPLPAKDTQWLPALSGMPCEKCVMSR